MKLGIIFEAPFDKFEKSDSAPAFASLRQQIITYAKAIEQDPNVLIIDAMVINTPGDYATRAVSPANAAIAAGKAQQTANLKAAAAKAKAEGPVTPATAAPAAPAKAAAKVPAKAKAVAKPEPVKVQKKEAVEGVVIEPTGRSRFSGGFTKTADDEPEVAPEAPATKINAEDSKYVIDKIFENLKRTKGSVAMITALASTGEEMTIPEIVTASGLDKNTVSAWLGQTAKNIKAIKNTGRGKYKLDYDSV